LTITDSHVSGNAEDVRSVHDDRAGSATAVPVDGGVLVNGTWPCISGA
jgi:hypothetical protein